MIWAFTHLFRFPSPAADDGSDTAFERGKDRQIPAKTAKYRQRPAKTQGCGILKIGRKMGRRLILFEG